MVQLLSLRTACSKILQFDMRCCHVQLFSSLLLLLLMSPRSCYNCYYYCCFWCGQHNKKTTISCYPFLVLSSSHIPIRRISFACKITGHPFVELSSFSPLPITYAIAYDSRAYKYWLSYWHLIGIGGVQLKIMNNF